MTSESSMTSTTRDKLLWIVVNTCRLLVSATFVFSGIVKLVDPVGMQYKIEDYLVALGIPLSPESIWPLTLAIVLPLVEFLLGVYLFFGIRRRLTSWGLLLFMAFYTPLTLWLAITNGVADCGCFGDAVRLTNWQTFWKNAVLLVLVIIIWWQGQRMTRFISQSAQWMISLYSIAVGLFVAWVSIVREPFVDFRPYHQGQHIPTAMEWPDDPMDVPEILDFDVDPAVLEDTSYTFLLISPHLELADDGAMDHINATYDFALREGYRFLALTASGSEAIRRWQDLTGAEYPFEFMDELALKTMARTNPAVMLLHNGTIVGKWAASQMPSEELGRKPLTLLAPSDLPPYHPIRRLLYLLLLYALPLVPLTLADRIYFAVKNRIRSHPRAKNN